MLESFHVQTLRPPNDTNASALGHKGTTATMTSGEGGHHTQLIWEGTTVVGCAMAVRGDSLAQV